MPIDISQFGDRAWIICAIWQQCRNGLCNLKKVQDWFSHWTKFNPVENPENPVRFLLQFSSHESYSPQTETYFHPSTFTVNQYHSVVFIFNVILTQDLLSPSSYSYRHWTCNCRRPVFLFLVYPNICTQWQTCDNLGSLGRQSFKKIMKEKNTLFAHFLCALRCIIKGFRSEVF